MKGKIVFGTIGTIIGGQLGSERMVRCIGIYRLVGPSHTILSFISPVIIKNDLAN